jgi:hypothetical protein
MFKEGEVYVSEGGLYIYRIDSIKIDPREKFDGRIYYLSEYNKIQKKFIAIGVYKLRDLENAFMKF